MSSCLHSDHYSFTLHTTIGLHRLPLLVHAQTTIGLHCPARGASSSLPSKMPHFGVKQRLHPKSDFGCSLCYEGENGEGFTRSIARSFGSL